MKGQGGRKQGARCEEFFTPLEKTTVVPVRDKSLDEGRGRSSLTGFTSKIFLHFICCSLFLFSLGCVKMRDYTYRENGSCGIMVKKEIGEGYKEGKDYYLMEDGIYFIVQDTKDEIVKKIGLPDKIEKTTEEEDLWMYPFKKLKLFFKGDYLVGWEEINN